MNTHLVNARDYLARGEAFYRKAAEEISLARADGLTVTQIADGLGRGEAWVYAILSWAKTPANDLPYTGDLPFSEGKGAVATRHTRSVLRQAEPEHLEQIVGDLPLGQLERIADATYEARKARIREEAVESHATVSDEAEQEISERMETVSGRGTPLMLDLLIAEGRAHNFGYERIVEEATAKDRREWAERLPDVIARLQFAVDLAKTVKIKAVETGSR